MITFFKDLFWNAFKKYQHDNCSQLAASITYYVIFSLFPLLIFLAGAVGLFLSQHAQNVIVDHVLDYIPLDQGDGRQTVDDAVRALSGSRAPLIGAIGLAGMAWSGSGMFTSIRRALNTIFDDPTYSRPWFWQKLIDLLLVLGVSVFFIASIAASAGLRLTESESDDLAWVGRLSRNLGFAWTLLEYLLPFALSLLAFSVLYTVVPSRNRHWIEALPGATVAAVLFEILKFGFGLYVTNVRNFDLVFGSLGAIATFMFWVFLSSQVALFGAEITDVYPDARSGKFRQAALENQEPFRTKAIRAIRSLFVRNPR